MAIHAPNQIMDETKALNASTAVYKYRFVILFLFCCFSMLNSFQWIQISIIQDIVVKYYGVSDTAVNWSALVFCAAYIPSIVPGCWLMEKKGLRYVIIVGSFGNALGACVKVFSIAPDRFWIVMMGQTIAAISQVFVLSIPPRLAAVWFGPTEVSKACSIGVFGNQVGVALGFQLPTLLVPNSEDMEEIESGLWTLHISVAVACGIVFLAVLFAFRDKPELPPSRAQIVTEVDFVQTLKNLKNNGSYILLLLAYGINVGAFYALSILLNQVVSKHFKGQNEKIGLMGFSLVIAGMVGSLFCGWLLDKTKKFKEITLTVTVLALAGFVAYAFVLQAGNIWAVFAIVIFLGFFLTGYLPIGFEFASELTYPEPEGTTSGLLNASAQIFGILFLTIATGVDSWFGDLQAHLALSAFMLVGTILTALCKSDLRRQKAFADLSESTENPSV